MRSSPVSTKAGPPAGQYSSSPATQMCAPPTTPSSQTIDDPELYVRAAKGKKAAKILTDICSTISKEFSSIKL